MNRRALVPLTLVLLAACAQKPTRVTETKQRPFDALVGKVRRPLELTDATVILDARGPFDFGLNHVGRAVSFAWEKLARNSDGEPLRDAHRAGERLALVGVNQQTPVVVIGNGPTGHGEEGRLAWSLLRLGVRDVQTTSNEPLRKFWTPEPASPPKNIAAWDPKIDEALELDPNEFKNLATSLSDLKAKRIWLIDVRTPKEYLEKPSVPGTINVEWTEFYTKDGRPDPSIRKKLRAIDIQPNDRVICLSPSGVRAAATAYALLSLEYANVQMLRR